MITIGITGGIATGKDTVADYLAQKGVIILDADKIGHVLLDNNDIKNELITMFGANIVCSDNTINRKTLADIVFSSDNNVKKLNKILHPEIIRRIKDAMEEHQRRTPEKIIAVNAALIFEFDIQDMFDVIILLHCKKDEQIKRAVKKGLREKDIERTKYQIPFTTKKHKAHFVIENNGSISELFSLVDHIWEKITDKRG